MNNPVNFDAQHIQAAAERLELVRNIFLRASEAGPESSDAILDEACGADKSLRVDVVRLLAHAQEARPDFPRSPIQGHALHEGQSIDKPDPLIGRQVGKFLVKSVIARGGMGVVYLADQERPRREIAMKVMRAGIANPRNLERFEHESQILASLRHPNIAHVYEAGTASLNAENGCGGGRPHGTSESGDRVPYFAMEYVPAAEPITKYAASQALNTGSLLERFLQVCDAVQYAHQKGVIHRDLKPANILVDGSGQVKVIDFGIARSMDTDLAVTTMQTDTGQLIGTLQYMSPEQCEADPNKIDTRSDVYSLGVVLYELLCNKCPYDLGGSSILKAARLICDVSPPRPSTINRKFRGNLEVIVLKALEKERAKRYQSVGELAGDIRRHLNHELITARPPGPWTKTLHWITKHPLLTTGAACTVMAAAIIFSTFFAVWWMNRRPYRIEAEKDNQCVRLMARSGAEVKRWEAGYGVNGKHDGVISFSNLITGLDVLNGRRLLVLGYNQMAERQNAGSLVGYDVDGDLEKPLWQYWIRETDLPERYKALGRTADEQGISFVWQFDVFKESPGPELVVAYVGKYSQRPLRIFGPLNDTKLLYQVWYEGDISSCHWMSEAGLLVLSGSYNDIDLNDPVSAAFGRLPPLIVFAVRPQYRLISNRFFDYKVSPARKDQTCTDLVWVKWVKAPPKYVDQCGVFMAAPRPWEDFGSRVPLKIQFSHPDLANAKLDFFLSLDAAGMPIPESVETTDQYRVAMRSGQVPDPREVHFEKLPHVSPYTSPDRSPSPK